MAKLNIAYVIICAHKEPCALVEKPGCALGEWTNAIKEYTLEKNSMYVISVVRPLQLTVIFKTIKEHILERNLMNVISVVRPCTLQCSSTP